jgi:glycerol-3-phosphate acyltransferase PlsX
MAVALRLVENGESDAFVTAGNSGGALAAALFGLGRIQGIKRPALGTIFWM